jgi:drug/metabolite transporter (DMT)-like permease
VNWTDRISIILLGALWGGSFLFMRIAVPEMGPVLLIEMRVLIAALVLLPLLIWRGKMGEMWRNGRKLFVVGLLNAALPLVLFAYATLSVSAGFAAILNTTVTFWTAIVAVIWLRERISFMAVLGMVVGFGGVVILVWDKLTFSHGGGGLAVIAGLTATLCYALNNAYTKTRLAGVDPMVTTAGNFLAAALLLSPLIPLFWPAHPISTKAWIMVVLLAVFSTALAFILFFRLIERIGPTRTIVAAFLIPVFASLWGWIFLGEVVTTRMALGAMVIVAGMGMTAGLLRGKSKKDSALG